MGKRIHTILLYALLVSVYGVFFSVESFFNFEGQGNATEFFSYSSSSQFARLHSDNTKAFPSHSSSSHLRLNKRYHQENVPPCTVYSVEAPESYVVQRVLSLYRDELFPSRTLIHRPLRGPPVTSQSQS